MAVIILSKKYKMNPDNLATPLAASIGDVVAISLFSFIASLLFQNLGEKWKKRRRLRMSFLIAELSPPSSLSLRHTPVGDLCNYCGLLLLAAHVDPDCVPQ